MVVIMIGRKRSRHALINRLGRRHALVALAASAKSTIMCRLLDDADEQQDADQPDDAEIVAPTSRISSAPSPAEGRSTGW